MWTGSLIAGILGFVGVVLLSLAGLVIVDYDLKKVVFVVAVAVIAMAVLVEAAARGIWK